MYLAKKLERYYVSCQKTEKKKKANTAPIILVPSSTNARIQEMGFTFILTPDQATKIACHRDTRPNAKLDYTKQIQMRFCLLDTTSEQEDQFPPSVCVKVNEKMCTLPVSFVTFIIFLSSMFN